MKMLSDLFVWLTVATVLLLLLEIVSGRHKGVYQKGDFPLLIGSFLVGRWLMVPLGTAIKGGLFALLFTQYQGALSGTPFWIAFPAVLLVNEFCFYWVHRWAHQGINTNIPLLPVLWKIHRTHHSGKHMNVSLLFRLNVTWFLIIPAGWVCGFALFLGLGEAVLVVLLVTQAWNLITHSHFRWDNAVRQHRWAGPLFRALEHVFVSPGIHHTHHGYGRDGKHYRNYGTVLSLYDWMFGTLHIPEGRPFRYGLPGDNAHWLEELFYPLVNMSGKDKVSSAAAAVEPERSQ
ncbi:MAG TPA: sterol desaturase family protein [Porticoccaceae bacterium]